MKKLYVSCLFISVWMCVLLSSEVAAKVSVLFHPEDRTFDKIISYFERAERSIDIAIYNIDASSRNRIIKYLGSDTVQKRIRSNDLEIRMIYEGYLTPEQDNAKCQKLEKLGIDVRRFVPGIPEDHRKAVDVHHKFAVIDGYTDEPLLISGSANWSLMSRYKYDENILYFEDEAEIAYEFQRQFVFLWEKSAEFGKRLSVDPKGTLPRVSQKATLSGYSNIGNFVFSGKAISKKLKSKYTLTTVLEKAIDRADKTIKIATTRISLEQLYLAIKRAAKRGIKVELLVNMDQYKSPGRRKSNKSYLLSESEYDGKRNVSLRIKFYNLAYDKKIKAGLNEFPTYLSHQMHSKYLIVDGKEVYTGSFNWSPSAEYNHIENLIYIDGGEYPELVKQFDENFDDLYTLRRWNLPNYTDYLKDQLQNRSKPKCFFDPMALGYQEIDTLLNLGSRQGINLKDFCRP